MKKNPIFKEELYTTEELLKFLKIAEVEPVVSKYMKNVANGWTEDIDIKEAIGEITLLRGITPECNIHNAVNREKMRILEVLGLK